MQLYIFHPLCPFILTILISTNLPRFTCSNNEHFSNCSQPFNCGSIQNLKFPFWGDNRPPYCGLPQFKLQCYDDVPIMTTSSQDYRILNIDPEKHKLRIARADYWDGICPSILQNTSIDYTLFDYATAPSYLTLFYGCSFPLFPPLDVIPHSFCKINGTQLDVFFSFGMSAPYEGCKYAVKVPVLDIPAPLQVVSVPFVTEALHQGFEVRWKLDDHKCIKCTVSGGQCGWDWIHKAFTCFCPDHAYFHGSQCVRRPGMC